MSIGRVNANSPGASRQWSPEGDLSTSHEGGRRPSPGRGPEEIALRLESTVRADSSLWPIEFVKLHQSADQRNQEFCQSTSAHGSKGRKEKDDRKRNQNVFQGDPGGKWGFTYPTSRSRHMPNHTVAPCRLQVASRRWQVRLTRPYLPPATCYLLPATCHPPSSLGFG